jgi:hypothetical protein
MMNQLVSAASGPKAARELGTSFMRGVSYMTRSAKMTKNIVKGGYGQGMKMHRSIQTKRENAVAESTDGGKKSNAKPDTSKPATNTKPLKTGETRKAERMEKP